MMARTAAQPSNTDTAKAGVPAARTTRQTIADLTFLARSMKAPALLDAAERLAERAQAESWSHLEYLVACLQREVSARDSHGGEGRIRAARFPAIKTIEELDLAHLRGMTRQQLAHLGTLDFIAAKENAIFLGPPGTGKTHIATGLAIRACQAGHRVAFATAAQWVDRLAAAHHAGRLQDELVKLGRYPLIVIDLCRDRDYAEAVCAVPLFRGVSAVHGSA
ncbi:ATP-binding protein [Kitasatospora sp. NPDC088264]|uniref:ATP-binding protein n=1 Tax=Kitasatospora sp. NPDC088264 TaxID=3155296 RepID=UPI00344721FB